MGHRGRGGGWSRVSNLFPFIQQPLTTCGWLDWVVDGKVVEKEREGESQAYDIYTL